MILRGAVFAITVCAGCATPIDHVAHIDTVISRCGLNGMITVARLSEREYRVTHLDNNATYEKVDCFLAGVRPLGLNWGFVGNYRTD